MRHGFGRDVSAEESSTKTRQGIMMIAGCLLGTAAPCASQDTGFARQAASGGPAEVSMGRLADSHAQRAGV